MEDHEIKGYINDTVNATVLKMKMAGLLKGNRQSAIEKTEELLRNYPTFRDLQEPYSMTLAAKIDEALKLIEDDPYYEIIPMFYFHNETREYIAEYFDCTVTTISRNKTRLLNKLKLRLVSKEVIEELFL